jgi:hypothetical protein
MLALSMGLMSKLGWKGSPAAAANGNDLSTSHAPDHALQGMLFSKLILILTINSQFLTVFNIKQPRNINFLQLILAHPLFLALAASPPLILPPISPNGKPRAKKSLKI